jgi:type I restriction enzyme R subunit/putative DNA methylase
VQEKVGQAVSPAKREFYCRRLPHWHPGAAFLFVTWRLFGSLPRSYNLGARELKETAGQRFLRFDHHVDRCSGGPVWLRDGRIAAMIVQTLRAGQDERGWYELRAYVIMPNHLHLVLQPRVELSAITRWLKGSTARKANQILGRTGQPFWQDESYDHWIRDDTELERIVRYVERNPVTAGLTLCGKLWPWSSAKAGETACPTVSSTQHIERM